MGVKSRFSKSILGEPTSLVFPHDGGANGSPNKLNELFNRPAWSIGAHSFIYIK